jgi:hypothetical protein
MGIEFDLWKASAIRLAQIGEAENGCVERHAYLRSIAGIGAVRMLSTILMGG